MESTSRFHDQVFIVLSMISVDIAHTMVGLHPPDTMFDPDAVFGDALVLGFLLECEFSSFGFFLGLIGEDILWFIRLVVK